MERISFSLLFYIRRTKLNKAGEVPIFMRITVNGQRADASARRFIEPRLWNTAKGKAVENGRGCKELNFYFDAVSANVLRIQRDMELEGAELSAHAVLDRYLGKERSERHTLIGLFIEHNEKQKKLAGIDVAPATAVRYETCGNWSGSFYGRRIVGKICIWMKCPGSLWRTMSIFLKPSVAVVIIPPFNI